MSKFVDEILQDIKTNPTKWKDFGGAGLERDNIILYGFGNTKLLSVCDIKINGKDMPLTYMDRWRIEKVIGKWYRTINLESLSN